MLFLASSDAGAPPVVNDTSAPAAKRGATLRFSSSDKASNKRKIVGRSYEDEAGEEEGTGTESFNDLVKRAKTDPSNAVTNKEAITSSVSKPTKKEVNKDSEVKEKDGSSLREKKPLTKEEKAALKAKRKAAKKLLSFED